MDSNALQIEEIMRQVKPAEDFRSLINQSAALFGEQEAFIVKMPHDGNDEKDNQYRHITYREFRDEIDALGTALVDLGLCGKHIAVIGENRYEWCLSYLAITCGCGVVVPVDKELKSDEIAMILDQADVSAVIYSGRMQEKYLGEAAEKADGLLYTICMDLKTESPAWGRGHTTIPDLLARGRRLLQSGDRRYLDAEIDPYKLSVLIFTSGTTGVAKGVMLSQKNICFDVERVTQCLDHNFTDSVLSILPIHHTYECTAGFLVMMYKGVRMAFCEGIRYIAKNIAEYSPTILILVPLILENVHDKVIRQVSGSKLKYAGFRTILWVSGVLQHLGIDVGRKIFHTVHETLGGKLRLVIAGAAAMNPKVSKDLGRMGFKIRQGYGLTECAPIVCVNRESGSVDKSVGPALPGIEVQIHRPNRDGEGEIKVRGANVMLGYYKAPEETAEVLKDGWLYTGDQGRMDKKGRVYITSRIKNIIVTKTGKNIYPEELEGLLKKVPYILESVVWGDDSVKEDDVVICATVVPNMQAIQKTGRLSENEKMQKDEIQKLIWAEIKKVNRGLPAYKRIQKIAFREEEFEKTTTQKIKRYIATITTKFYDRSGS